MLGSVCADGTSVLHWLVCRLCHYRNGRLLNLPADTIAMVYRAKCHWLLTRGGTIRDLRQYNFWSVGRMLSATWDLTAEKIGILPCMSFM